MKFLFYFFSLLLLLSCGTPKAVVNDRAQQKDSTIVNLEEGQQLFLQEEQMNVSFNRLLEDSRCPKGVQCVWAGVAAIELELTGVYTRPQKIILATTKVPDKQYATSVIFNGYRILLQDLSPYPSSSNDKKDSERYRATLAFNRQSAD